MLRWPNVGRSDGFRPNHMEPSFSNVCAGCSAVASLDLRQTKRLHRKKNVTVLSMEISVILVVILSY
jgi:hypothetical protein